MPQEAPVTLFSLPLCPDDKIAWDESGQCPKCGLLHIEADSLMAAAVDNYEAARKLALRGFYDEAKQSLRSARENGLQHDAIIRLGALCAAVTGDWTDVSPEHLPDDWQEAAKSPSSLEFYLSARTALEGEDHEIALRCAEDCLTVTPWLLPAQKLRLLCRAASGQRAEALQKCRELLTLAPEDVDLLRYLREWMPVTETPASVQLSPPSKQKPRLGLLAGGTAILVIVSLTTGLLLGRQIVRSPASVSVSPMPSEPQARPVVLPLAAISVAGAAHRVASMPLSKKLSFAVQSSHRRADLRQARHWLRAGFYYYKNGDYANAARLSSAAAWLGRGSLVEHHAQRFSLQIKKAEKKNLERKMGRS